MKVLRRIASAALVLMTGAAGILCGAASTKEGASPQSSTSPATASAEVENLLYNGDFELPCTEGPPPGWSMWGASQFKIPANFTRDTSGPHGGKACFRIHHPAGSEGYIVSSPEHAIRPRRDMMYAVTFRARTDRPGQSVFGFTAYESIKPFLDAPSPGFHAIDVGKEWKQYAFDIHEGWDIFADQSKYLLLTFKATKDQKEAKTLWIDDVVVTERKSAREGRLVDERTLKYAPLEHRLRSGQNLEFTVDAGKRLGAATKDAGGVSFHRVAGWTGQPYDKQGQYALKDEMEQAIREMHLPMTRFYAVGDEPFGLEAAIDKVAEVCRRVKVPQDHVVLEFETQGATRKLPPETWAKGVQYSLGKGYKFRHWEVTNEPFVVQAGAAPAFATSDDYVRHFKAVSEAVHKVHPAGQVGIAVNPGSPTWCNYALKQAAGSYDFVVGHYYAVSDAHRRKFEAAVLTENFKVIDRILRVGALIRQYNPGREVYQYDTEWGMHSGGPKGERADYVDRNANIFGTIHRAVRLIHYAREDILRGASSWQMFSRLNGQGFGVLSQDAPEKRFLIYWLYYYFNRHVGEQALDMDGTAPYYVPAQGDDPLTKPNEFAGPLTPALVTLSKDGGSLYLVIANGSWERSIPCRMKVRNFNVTRAAGTVLSHPDPDGKPLLERKEDAVADLPIRTGDQQVQFTIPPHSVVFVTVE